MAGRLGYSFMSKAIKQFLVAAAVVAISMVFVIQFRPGANKTKGSAGPRCAIEVSGDCIPHSDFVAAFRLAAPSVDAEAIKKMRLRQIIAEGLIERWLLLQDAERLGITVSDKDVTRHLGKLLARFSLPVAQEDSFTFMLARAMPGQILPSPMGPARRMLVSDPKTHKFDYERYKRWVGRMSNKTLADFRVFQRQEAVAARMRALVRTRVRVGDAEAYQKFARANAKAVVRFVKLERAFYRDYVLDRSGAALDGWVEDNGQEVDEAWNDAKDRYLPECRRARQILVRIDETLPDKADAEKKARTKIEAAKQRIDAGEAFADVAREVSEDATTASHGGELGCFAAGKLAKPNTTKAIDDAVFALHEGKVSEIIKTGKGLHLVRLDAVASGDDAEKVGRHEVALELYLRKEAERMAAEGAKQILAAVRGGKSLQAALDAHLDAVLPEAAKEAFEKGKASVAGKPADKEKGKDEQASESADEAFDAWTDPTRPKVRKSDPFTSAGPPFPQVQSPTEATRMLFELKKPGEVPNDVIKLYDGYAVAQLVERKPVEKADWAAKRDDFIARLRREKGRDALAEYVQRLRDKYAKEVRYNIAFGDDEADGKK